MPFQLDSPMYYTCARPGTSGRERARLLASLRDGEWCTGAASDLKARLSQHERGEVSSTRFRRPWQLIYYEACREAADAYRRERYLKTGRGKRYLRQRLKTWRMHLASDGSECPILGLPLLPEYSERPEKSWNGTRRERRR